jgi:hypothetical protein
VGLPPSVDWGDAVGEVRGEVRGGRGWERGWERRWEKRRVCQDLWEGGVWVGV